MKRLFFILLTFTVLQNYAQEVDSASIDDLNRQLENPLSRFWSLIFQENMAFNSGDIVKGKHMSNVFNFQPSLPVPVGESKMLLIRPVFPLVTALVFDENGEKTGTDIQYILRKQFKGKGMSIGMGPNISVNLNAESGNKVTFPIGLGVTKTVNRAKPLGNCGLNPSIQS